MNSDYRDRLFASYNATHAALLDLDEQATQAWFFDYARKNYWPLIGSLDVKCAEVLEVACNKGYLLSALSRLGFERLRGIDLSPEDLAQARRLAPNADVANIDAFDYLDQTPTRFDVVILKAMLEHVPKAQTMSLLEKINCSLRPGGFVIIDVPNMDWLLAGHERYMDFTHEAGFTKESLGQVMRNVFSNVSVRPAVAPAEPGLKGRVIAWLRSCSIAIVQVFLRIIGEGASDVLWHSRAIIGVGQKHPGR